MNFDLGLRVGELAVIKWSDINWINETIFIQRQEDSDGIVEDYVKSDSSAGYRELELSDNVIAILKRIRKESTVLSEFVFCNEKGERKIKRAFEGRLAESEIALGNERELKHTHCIRRTVGSRMHVSGFSIEEIRRWLGHTNKETTLRYIYNPFRASETKNKVKKTQYCLLIKVVFNCLQKMKVFQTIKNTEKSYKIKEKSMLCWNAGDRT